MILPPPLRFRHYYALLAMLRLRRHYYGALDITRYHAAIAADTPRHYDMLLMLCCHAAKMALIFRRH